VLQDEKEYLKLLKVIGNNQKYDFYSQLSIYNKEPEASDSLNENIFSLSRIYGDKYIHLALTDLRIDIEGYRG
jgi:superfamily II DNA and RNA helicase